MSNNSEEEDRPPAPPLRMASASQPTSTAQKPLPSVPHDNKRKDKIKNEKRGKYILGKFKAEDRRMLFNVICNAVIFCSEFVNKLL